VSWAGVGIVAIGSIGPQYQGLSPKAGTLVSVALRSSATIGNCTLALYNAGALIQSQVFPPGPSTIVFNAGYPAGALRELRLIPGLLASGVVDFTCRWRG
jgi:hypothetical protein